MSLHFYGDNVFLYFPFKYRMWVFRDRQGPGRTCSGGLDSPGPTYTSKFTGPAQKLEITANKSENYNSHNPPLYPGCNGLPFPQSPPLSKMWWAALINLKSLSVSTQHVYSQFKQYLQNYNKISTHKKQTHWKQKKLDASYEKPNRGNPELSPKKNFVSLVRQQSKVSSRPLSTAYTVITVDRKQLDYNNTHTPIHTYTRAHHTHTLFT